MIRHTFIALTGLGIATPALGHYIPGDNPVDLTASVVATWRSDDVVKPNDYWQIPGTLMGGHAWPYEKGVAVDEALVGLGARINEQTFAVIEVGSHGGGDSHGDNVELQHAYVGFECCEQRGPWVLEVGRMSAAFSPSLMSHASDRLVTESPIVDDVFFGRDFHDEGVRLWWHETAGWSAGAEYWRGKAFPANSDGDGAWDVFARHSWKVGSVDTTLGGWYYGADASARADHRYGGGHTHTPVAPPGETAEAFSDTRYTGDVDVYGIHAGLEYRLSTDWALGLKGEWMQLSMDGTVHDAVGRQARLDADQQGFWLQPTISWRRHTFGFRGEMLTTDNHLTGSAAAVLAEDSGLANPSGHDPMRYTAVWRYQWRPDVAFRAEVIQDETLADDEMRFALGVVWHGQLWPQGSSHSHH